MVYYCKKCQREVPEEECKTYESGTLRHKGTMLGACRGVIILTSGKRIEPKKTSTEKLLRRFNVKTKI